MQAPLWDGHEMTPVCLQCPDLAQPDPYMAMEKLPSAPNFSVKGFNAKNGYAK